MREPKTALKETCTLDINQNRNNPGLSQLDGTEEMVSQAFGCFVRQFKKNGRRPLLPVEKTRRVSPRPLRKYSTSVFW